MSPPSARQLPNALPDVESCMPSSHNLYYDGNFQAPIDGVQRDVYNAGNGSVITQVAYAGAKDTVAALESAQRAQRAWAAVSAADRGRLLRKAAEVVRTHAIELALLDSYNIGSPIALTFQDSHQAADYIDFFAGMIPAVTGDTHLLSEDAFNYTIREPLGVIARIVASNHPLMFACFKLAPALAMGNTVVIKTPDQAPLSGLLLAQLLGSIFPPGVLNILSGGIECGKVLSTHPIVAKITLVGSLPTGRAIMKAAADTMKETAFELGGKNALIGYPDADLDKLVNGVVKGMNWTWCGQSCGSTSRVFLHHSIHDEVLERAAERIQAEYVPGNPMDPKTTMGALCCHAAQQRVLSYIKIGKEEGARLVIGGKPPSTPDTAGGYFVEPTVFADVEQSMRIAQEEIFGPVMSVLKWEDEDEMFRQVNSIEYGLSGAVYTRDVTRAQRAARRIQAGTVWINEAGPHTLWMPWGGYKQSGIGREDCFEELVAMTQTKVIHLQL